MYVTIKLKVDTDGKFSVESYEGVTKAEAEYKALTILAEAARTEDPVTTALVLNEYGAMVRRPESVKHGEEEEQNGLPIPS